MESRKEKAMGLFKQGYNCSQSVFAAFSDLYGIDEETALKISSSFGGGMGRMREVCGAVSGMLMVAGLETGTTDGKDREGKAHNYAVVQELAEEYRKRNGSIICRELLGLDKKEFKETMPEERTKEYYKKRPCAELVGQAAEIIENVLLKDK
ncbi:C_GCAxxG_C_C family protein [Lachnospiraceae bacterium KM106-2]|nr:C_GCAxxG_C_C family protein [Lachnospiraceae bacterium KM106-2]